MNSAEAEIAYNALPSLSSMPWNERHEKVAEIEAEWRTWLETTYATDAKGWKFPQNILNEIFTKAWEDGHINGYYEVESCYQDLAKFAFTIVALFDPWLETK